ncbi:MAG TPA: acyltransferase family protein [Lachnospiraceae bacterium]|nr:acyltransferase family protein [Lachnospiraceae bacterium]
MEKRNYYLDNLRVIACVLIVGVHVSAYNLEDRAIGSFPFLITNAYDCLAIIGVPLFVMISGALLLQDSYKITFRKLFRHKIPRLVIAYFFWLTFFNVINCYQEGYGYSWDSIKHNIILNTLLGNGIYHLWFIPMIIGIYLLIPFFKKIASDELLCRYFLILYFVISIFMPTLLKFDFRFKTIVLSLYERIPFSMVIGYTGYFILGHYLHTYVGRIKRSWLIVIAIVGFLAYQASHLTCYFISVQKEELSTILNDPLTVPDCLAAIAIFLLVKQLWNTRSFCSRIAKYSFGIYLIHPFFLMVAGWIGLDTLFLPAVISIPIVVIGLFGLSLLVIFLLSKIPVLNKTIF